MSTKSSYGWADITEKKIFHIYLEGLDGKYYLETNHENIELPEDIAKGFARVLEDFQRSKPQTEEVGIQFAPQEVDE